jgi:Ca2+-binding RTX toxin-like protein
MNPRGGATETHDLPFEKRPSPRGRACRRRPGGRRADRAAAPAQAAYTHAVADGTLTITGDDAGDKLSLGVAEGDGLLVADVGMDGTVDFTAELGAFDSAVVDLGGGNDTFAIDETHGRFTHFVATTVRGGAGWDFITGGSGPELLAGGDGDDQILGHRGNDALLGDAGNDVLQADEGNDHVLGGEGDDRTYVWTTDDNDAIDGGPGDDLTHLWGTYLDDRFEVQAAPLPGHVTAGYENGPQQQDLSGVERLAILTSSGRDAVLAGQHLDGLIALTADLGAGDDVAVGGDGDDQLDGGPGEDELRGRAGNDRFGWSPGDGAGSVDGGAGVDTFAVAGTEDQDGFSLRDEPAAGTSSLTRFAAQERSTLRDVETVEGALAGGDDLMVATSARTGVRMDGGAGADTFRFGGTEEADHYTALRTRAPGHVRLINDRLPSNHDAVATERFDVFSLAGDDTATIGAGLGALRLRMDAGPGADSVQGGEGDDLITGGEGPDVVRGGPGGDSLHGDEGDDVLAGEAGADALDGGAGVDTL